MKCDSVHCPVCQTSTIPTRVGTADYCSTCGNRYDAKPVAQRQMDIRPAGHAAAHTAHTLSHSRTSTLVKPASVPAAKPAAALHRGRATAQVLDLRKTKPAAKPTEAHIEHPAHHTPAPAPSQAAQSRHSDEYAHRLQAAKQVSRSPLIQKFGGAARSASPAVTQPTPAPHHAAAPAHSATTPVHHASVAASAAEVAGPQLPNQVVTQHQAMNRLAPAPAAAEPATHHRRSHKPSWRPHLGLSPHRGRILTTAATLAIMSGYIWLQNSPKLALQTASSQAGVAASLPGYLPSSYNLASTKTAPGLVTLDFTSPSISEILKIAQHRTTWDSRSLLDNFVAKQTDDYSTVHGQGLTIYVFGENRAAWVNHGIWYSIEGASKLSREQILKIAYSL